MTTLQPRLVRADTLDLQSHNAPSAKDHSRSPTFTPYSHGAAGSHHREALRHAEESTYHDIKTSPRLSNEGRNSGLANPSNQYDSTDDDGDDEQQDEKNSPDPNEGEYEDGPDENDDDLEDDLLDKISSSPSIEDEDIDFEFVYALHTFVATVEGQANATKGDTMVLLDDSNSYWWLVRVVKDGSIGYLPAEHIETPTERLARLNKHRNIDLSASMLGDNPEKSKNPLKKAMRRRNAKTVAFAAPTYYEPSEYEYDTEDEEDQEGMEGIVHSQQQQQNVQQTDTSIAQEGAEPAESHDGIVIGNGIKKAVVDDQMVVDSPTSPVKSEATEPVLHQTQIDDNIQRSRNGVVRNTDSFFKDDTVETKKISLTPRLLRNDTDSTTTTELDLRSKASADTFDKLLGPDERPKEKEKEKKKEKKGMLSGLFKRKDKSAKNAKIEVEDEKTDDTSRSSQTKESLESAAGPQSPDRKPSKLQKTQQSMGPQLKNSSPEIRQSPSQIPVAKSPTHSPKSSESGIPNVTPIAIQQESPTTATTISQPVQGPAPVPALAPAPLHTEKRSIFAPITTALKSSPSNHHHHEPHIKPVYSKRAKERFAIDASDSEDDHTPTMSQVSHAPQDLRAVSPMRDSQIHNSRPDSGMEVSPVDASDSEDDSRVLHPAGLPMRNTTGAHHTMAQDIHGTPQSDTASTSKPSPSLATHTPSTSRSTPTWSDASLRSYMENDQDIRDLLIIVHDKSNITPVGPDHPLMGGMFMTERTRLAEMQTQLDSMLTTWISKKNPGLLAR